MSSIEAFLQLGIKHILNIHAIDHLLFIVALCSIYTLQEWKKAIWMATAFTIAHALTLLLAIFDWQPIPSVWIEYGILLSIILMALKNILSTRDKNISNGMSFVLTFVFGLIHGMGFSNYLRSILMPGEKMWENFLSFTLGIELGQIAIITAYFLLFYVISKSAKFKMSYWIYFWNILILCFTVYLLLSL